MLELLLIVAFTGHLVAVNMAAAGPFYCVATEWMGSRRGDEEILAIARRLAVLSLVGFAIGLAIGVLLLVNLWYTEPSYWSALARVRAYRWWFFGGELVFYLVCMIAYVALWKRVNRSRRWHRLLAILAATNLIYHFPPLFTMLSLMSTRAELADAVLDRSLYVRLFTDAETLARVAHHWLSSLATAGVLSMVAASRQDPRLPAEQESARVRVVTLAASAALLATVLQLPTGLWLLLASPASVQSQLLGGDMISTAIFVTAILATVLLLQQLAAAAFGDGSRATVFKTAFLLALVLLLMSGVLRHTRVRVGSAPRASRPITGLCSRDAARLVRFVEKNAGQPAPDGIAQSPLQLSHLTLKAMRYPQA